MMTPVDFALIVAFAVAGFLFWRYDVRLCKSCNRLCVKICRACAQNPGQVK